VKKIILLLLIAPGLCKSQFVTQGICTRSGEEFTINGISQTPYAGRFFCTTAANLNNNFDLTFNAYLGNPFNNGMAFLFIPGAMPTATTPPTVISTDNIQNFGTGSITNDFVIEFDIRGSFCTTGQNTSYEPTTDINHISYWKNNSACTFGNYYSPYSALGTINYYAFEPYRIKWTKSTNTLETYYNNVLVKSNVVDLVGLLGSTVYWGFSSGCYCVTGGPTVKDMYLNNVKLLPVILKDFTAEKNNKTVNLNWQTAQELNSSHFIIEKSIDGTNFSFLQKVNAVGNSSLTQKYATIDAQPFYGTNFYRVKMVDLDGRFTYSDVAAIKFDYTGNEIALFPNPVKDVLQLQIPADKKESCSIQIQDMLGKIVKEETVALSNGLFSTAINVTGINAGVYLLVVKHGTIKEVKRFIKQ
jgi:hypothetical protein